MKIQLLYIFVIILLFLKFRLKIEFNKEWVHLRKSNTEPIIRIYAESQSEATANHLAEKLIMDMKQFIK